MDIGFSVACFWGLLEYINFMKEKGFCTVFIYSGTIWSRCNC